MGRLCDRGSVTKVMQHRGNFWLGGTFRRCTGIALQQLSEMFKAYNPL